MRIPIDNVQKQVESETTQSVSGNPTYHSGSTQTSSVRHTFSATCTNRIRRSTSVTVSGSTSASTVEKSGSDSVTVTCDKGYGMVGGTMRYRGSGTITALGPVTEITSALGAVSSSFSGSTIHVTAESTTKNDEVKVRVSYKYETTSGSSTGSGSTSISDCHGIVSVSPTSGYLNGYNYTVSYSGNVVRVSVTSQTPTSFSVPVTVTYDSTDATGSDSYTVSGADTITSITYYSGDNNYDSSISGNGVTLTFTGSYGESCSTTMSIRYRYTTAGYYSGVTKTIDLGDDKFVTAVSVVSKNPSEATVTPTKTEHGASVYLYQNSSSTITATIKLEYYYYETVKEAKVKFNGVVYKHIKYNGEIVI